MKLFVRILKILVVSGLIAAAGAWLALYYLNYRVGDLKAIKVLQWEPLIVIASIWFIANLVVVYLLSQKQGKSDSETVTPMLSGAALADLHADDEAHTTDKVKKKSDKLEKPSKKQSKAIPAGASSGIIKWFNGQKGYGFITSEEGDEVFVHSRSIKGANRQLHTGQQVSFKLLREDKGLKAEEVEILE